MDFLANTLTPNSFFDYVQWGGIVFILTVGMFGFYKKWWVMGWQYKQECDDKLRWMELALRSTNLAENYADLRRERPL